MDFVIDDGDDGADSCDGALPRMVRRSIEILDGLDDGVLISTFRITQSLGVDRNSFLQHTRHPLFREYKTKHHSRNINYYGNKKTIEEYKKLKTEGGQDEG